MGVPRLFSSLELRSLHLRNRIVVSPMCQYKAVDGKVQDWHFRHHSRFALGGSALAFVEATGVTAEGRITYGCTGIWDDYHIPGLKKIVEIYKAEGMAVGIQIGHAGRRASAALPWHGALPLREDGVDSPWTRIGPSAIPEQEGYPAPRSMTDQDILEVVDAFSLATKRALECGFDTVEVHGAHGYLLHSFFSPISNRRNDQYGGTLQRRMTFPLLVTEAVRAAWPTDMPIFYRVSAVDNVPGGISIEDTVALATELKKLGVDVVDCSSGGMSGPTTLSTEKLTYGYQVPYSEAVRAGADTKTMAVGLIIDPQHAEQILADEQADLVALAREMLSDSAWAYHAALQLGHDSPYDVLPPPYAFHLQRRAKVLEDA